MRGIADGANANGARWLNRKLDLTDIAVANTAVELGELHAAVGVTPTGLEGILFDLPGYARGQKKDSVMEHCSAFAATGPATLDGKMVIGHVTWWPLTLAEQTNVMLDIKPETGHRVLIQSYPGGIESGTDWYQNDAGVVLTETTIRQSPVNIEGTPVEGYLHPLDSTACRPAQRTDIHHSPDRAVAHVAIDYAGIERFDRASAARLWCERSTPKSFG